jgi:DNA polymerase I
VSKPLDGYSQNTQNVAALKRTRDQDLPIHPGQDIEYVVVDDEKTPRERVALAHEEIKSYDLSYYETELVRAVESVLSPLGWDRSKIRRELARLTKHQQALYVRGNDDLPPPTGPQFNTKYTTDLHKLCRDIDAAMFRIENRGVS